MHVRKKRQNQPSTISFLSLLLKVWREGASLTSELNWFQSLGPRNEIDFCPFDVLKRGTRKSASVFLSLIVVTAEFCTNSSDRYSGARLFVDLYIMVAVSLRIMSEIVGHVRDIGMQFVVSVKSPKCEMVFSNANWIIRNYLMAVAGIKRTMFTRYPSSQCTK